MGDEDGWARALRVGGSVDLDGDGAVAVFVVEVDQEGVDLVRAGVCFVRLAEGGSCGEEQDQDDQPERDRQVDDAVPGGATLGGAVDCRPIKLNRTAPPVKGCSAPSVTQ